MSGPEDTDSEGGETDAHPRMIPLGSKRQSGRTTLMLATLAGLQRMGTPALYVCATSSLAARARALAGHDLRCMSVEQFVHCVGLVGTKALGFDDTALWPAAMLAEAQAILRDRPVLTFIWSH